MDAFSSYSLAGSGPMYVKKGWSSSSAHGGAGGSGTRISSIYSGSRLGSGSVLGGIRREGGYHVQTSIAAGTGGFAMGNDKSTMQHLNDRLATYLETVRNLETVNEKLEVKIRETLQKSGPAGKDYSHYEATLVALRKQILEAVIANARVASQLDNTSLAADDFQAKLGYETEMCQIVEADVSKLRKVLDDTNIIRMHLESDIESLKEELISLKKNHEVEVMELRAVISASSVQVDVDAPKGQDLAQIMEEMRAKYEKMALKNRQELKAWHESKITEVQIQVTENTTALMEASSTVSESSRRMQSLQIELQSEMSLKASLEGTLRDVEMRYTMLLEKYQGNILCLQAELTQLRSNIQDQGQEYQALFNIKMKLEAEIQTYRRLLEGGDFRLEEALEESVLKKSVKQTNTKTIIQTLVDGKVVASETSEVKSTQP